MKRGIPEGRQCGCGVWNDIIMRKADFLGGIEIPSYVCSNCGEVYFDQSQAELIDVIRTARRDKEAAEARLAEAEKHPNQKVMDALLKARDAESRLRDAEARVGELATGIQDAIDLLTNANPGVCMCGGDMSKHSATDNHPPMSMLDYYGGIWVTEAQKQLTLPATGAFDRLRNEVLEEAAKIADDHVIPGLAGQLAATRAFQFIIAEAIRAAKKENKP